MKSVKMTRTRVQYPRCSLVSAVAVILCYLMLKMYHHLVVPLDSKSPPFHQIHTRPFWSNISKSGTASPPAGPYTVQENFTCSANDSAEVIPSHLPQSYQEFLRYRHCRAFPILLTPSPCEDDLYLLLAVKSTAVNVDRRAALRDTWGCAGRIQGHKVKLVFLMGRSHDKVQDHDPQQLLQSESRHYGDILQWDFADIFFNLPRKEVGFLSWFSRKCSSAQFVFKGDDDMFVNTENLVEFLTAHKPENHLFAGFIHSPEMPIRDRSSKYFVPVEIYPEGKLYPPFPSGGGYLMSRQTMLGLDVAAQKVKLLPLDDVFLGLCLQQMGVKLTHHRGFLTFGIDNKNDLKRPCFYRGIMLMHKMSPVELRVMWLLMQDSPPCGSSGSSGKTL
ncbi:N-acetyllactosaminide beta-1,3-N-acetylglucosaminyltransferase 4-like isoform X1 [Alosa sapidissima]|uniref:N-acetyllactosaminide beta-1,3-N-acetylglucosaminyltransferase 4-like isoform X1 n=2 Tax=Alosa sapidissima TaxID=34773 RepID=UPI001C090AD0|nr:N-acetyllactosaminide beta-1,3-N-acetylglucosaminyltransferase 4-like isoform X1 [Alosa sapidissima]